MKYGILAGALVTTALVVSASTARPAAAQEGGAFTKLGDIMAVIQLRHFKLWFAGDLENWPLAQYELEQIQESFTDAATRYRNIPVDTIAMIQTPLATLSEAIGVRNHARFGQAFKDLTTTCNNCHESAQVGFIVIGIPTASPFSNQSFSPRLK